MQITEDSVPIQSYLVKTSKISSFNQQDQSQHLIPKYSVNTTRYQQEDTVNTDINDQSHNSQMLPPRQTLRLKPLNLLLDQKKIESSNDSVSSNKSDYDVSTNSSPGSLEISGEVNPFKLDMVGIKKYVSENCIIQFFSKNNVEVVKVSISNGLGFVLFKNREDSVAWTGKVIQIEECSIKMRKPKVYHESNVLRINGLGLHIRYNDLHDFFRNEGCIVDDISLASSSLGFVTFRSMEDAAAWSDKTIIVNSVKIKFRSHWQGQPMPSRQLNTQDTSSSVLEWGQQESMCEGSDREKRFERERMRSREDKRNKNHSGRNDGGRSRSRERKEEGRVTREKL
eukprot:GFUD01027574.1.p1 GENE.GFUD01027574.1~~GFUD01027574.1.p1  ORF type:complete len:340 (+),score=63.18 GFUD01027574.1:662-1681(+)